MCTSFVKLNKIDARASRELLEILCKGEFIITRAQCRFDLNSMDYLCIYLFCKAHTIPLHLTRNLYMKESESAADHFILHCKFSRTLLETKVTPLEELHFSKGTCHGRFIHQIDYVQWLFSLFLVDYHCRWNTLSIIRCGSSLIQWGLWYLESLEVFFFKPLL